MGAIRARTVGGRRIANRMRRAAVQADRELTVALEQAAVAGVFIYRGRALFDTGRLRKGINRRFLSGTVVQIEAHATDPDTGFDYVGVTRFGHRVARIVAKKGRALRFTIGGRVLFRHSVRGFHPATDWAERAKPEVMKVIRQEAFAAARRLAGEAV